MKRTLNESDFIDAFRDCGRQDQFTYNGLRALFDYLEEMEQDTGDEWELDVIALCCDFSEYESLADFQNDYSDTYETIDDIRDETTVIEIDDDSFIIQAF